LTNFYDQGINTLEVCYIPPKFTKESVRLLFYY
jgi:hypothetical protein